MHFHTYGKYESKSVYKHTYIKIGCIYVYMQPIPKYIRLFCSLTFQLDVSLAKIRVEVKWRLLKVLQVQSSLRAGSHSATLNARVGAGSRLAQGAIPFHSTAPE